MRAIVTYIALMLFSQYLQDSTEYIYIYITSNKNRIFEFKKNIHIPNTILFYSMEFYYSILWNSMSKNSSKV